MDTLLMAAIVVTALAVIVQAGVLVAMYLMSRQVADRVNALVKQSQRLVTPMENVTQNLKSASTDLADMGKTARAQAEHVNEIVMDVRQAVGRLSTNHGEQNSRLAGLHPAAHLSIRSLLADSGIQRGRTKQTHFQLLPGSCWIDVDRSIRDS